MVRTSPLAAIMTSAMTSFIILNIVGQPTSAFVTPLSSSGSIGIKNCLHRPSSLSSSSSFIRRMPLRSTVEGNVEEMDILKMNNDTSEMPQQNRNGIYDLLTKEDHLALLAAHPGKIIITKFFAPWCRSCKGLEPKFVAVSKDEKYSNLPLLFAQMTVQDSKDYIKSLGILALPSVQIYTGTDGLVENFPCGPSKIPILKKKIAQVVNSNVDSNTLQLKLV